jgi:hypothetical protein
LLTLDSSWKLEKFPKFFIPNVFTKWVGLHLSRATFSQTHLVALFVAHCSNELPPI